MTAKKKHSTFLHPKGIKETLEKPKDDPDPPTIVQKNEEVSSKESSNGCVRIKGQSQSAVKGTTTAGLAVILLLE